MNFLNFDMYLVCYFHQGVVRKRHNVIIQIIGLNEYFVFFFYFSFKYLIICFYKIRFQLK